MRWERDRGTPAEALLRCRSPARCLFIYIANDPVDAMSFKQKLAVFAVLLVVSQIAVQMTVPWVTLDVVLGTLGLLIDYPAILVMLGGVVIAGLVGDRLSGGR